MSKVLIVEDEEAIADIEKDYLELSGFEVTICKDGTSGLAEALDGEYDICILDVMLPGIDGFEICKKVRETKNIPIIMVSAKKEDIDKIRGLGVGADDYMTKPFSKVILVSKIRAIVRRTQQYTSPVTTTVCPVLQRGCFTLHLDSQLVLKNNTEISLSSKEFALLYFFLENSEKVLSKKEIFSRVWQNDVTDDNTILVYIKRLRDKIEDTPSKPVHLTTVWGKGYRFFP